MNQTQVPVIWTLKYGPFFTLGQHIRGSCFLLSGLSRSVWKFLSIVDYSPNAYKDLFSQIPKSWTPYLYHSNSLSPSFFLSKSPWPRWHGLLISVNKTVEFGIKSLAFGDLVLLQEVKFQGSNQRKIYFLSLAVGQVNCWNTWCSVVWMYNNLIDSLILWRLS